MYKVYSRINDKLLQSFKTRKDAVYWCKVNQISLLPDGEWEDDYYIAEVHYPSNPQ